MHRIQGWAAKITKTKLGNKFLPLNAAFHFRKLTSKTLLLQLFIRLSYISSCVRHVPVVVIFDRVNGMFSGIDFDVPGSNS